MTDQTRNLNPTAGAIMAIALWGPRYAAQNGGAMDFWDKLSPPEKQLCIDLVERVREADKRHGIEI